MDRLAVGTQKLSLSVSCLSRCLRSVKVKMSLVELEVPSPLVRRRLHVERVLRLQ